MDVDDYTAQLIKSIDTSDVRLFGNEAAEDEDPKRLNAYFVEKPEFGPFESDAVPLSIVRARKGVGKSALLARVGHIKRQDPSCLVISLTGADLVGQRPFNAINAAELVNDWQQRLCFAINVRIGQEIGLAFSDDSISLVETSELLGFRERNLVGSLVDRLKGKVGKIETQKLPVSNHVELLSRFQNKHQERTAWVLVDDIDATFRSEPADCLKASSFFSAVRLLARQVRGIRVRASVRSDVWSTIRRTDEALDKVEQYIFDLRWSRRETKQVLARRLRAYLTVLDQEVRLKEAAHERDRLIAVGVITPSDHVDPIDRMSDGDIIRVLFDDQFPWGQPHEYLHALSGGRPRWSTQLCRLAAAVGNRAGEHRSIKFGFIKLVLEPYGRLRIDDLTREHRHQCPQIDDVIQTFARQRVSYTTDELLAFIDATILRLSRVEIDGHSIGSAMQVAQFLFRCDFLMARDESDAGLPLYRFEDKPKLLASATNPDEGMTWEIAPAYRRALSLSNSSSRKDDLAF